MEEHKRVALTPEPEEAKRALRLALAVTYIPNHLHGMKHEADMSTIIKQTRSLRTQHIQKLLEACETCGKSGLALQTRDAHR